MARSRYPVPAGFFRQELEVKRSRFIATLAPAASVDEARQFIENIRKEFPDARHNCWAFLLGPPGSSDRVGLSDDGEPSGTAGKPMLQAPLHCGAGDLVVVVSRYFGGIKLGTGGLVGAYGQTTERALESMPRGEKIAWAYLKLGFDYSVLELLQRDLPQSEVEILEETFSEQVTWYLRLPEERETDFRARVVDRSHGRVRFDA